MSLDFWQSFLSIAVSVGPLVLAEDNLILLRLYANARHQCAVCLSLYSVNQCEDAKPIERLNHFADWELRSAVRFSWLWKLCGEKAGLKGRKSAHLSGGIWSR